jgi:hypothetical protein
MPRPLRSIDVTVNRSTSSGHSGAHRSELFIPPCTSSSGGPLPAVTKPMVVPSALRAEPRRPSTVTLSEG